MLQLPNELQAIIPGVFPLADPRLDRWRQAEGMALVAGPQEAKASDTPTMSAMFAMMKAYIA